MPESAKTFAAVGQAMRGAQAQQGQQVQKPGQQTQPSFGDKPFDLNLYFKAVGIFFNDFFGKKIPYFFQNMGPVFGKAGEWWNRLPQDEQISYTLVAVGNLMFVAGVVLFFMI